MHPEFPGARKIVCIREPEHFADFQRLESVQRWAAGMGLALDVMPLPGLNGAEADYWEGTGLAWAPFRHTDSPAIHQERCQAMRAIPEHIPLVLDMDNPASLLPAVKEHLEGRRLACRAVRNLPPDPVYGFTVPYSNYPALLEPAPVRDVVMIDTHKWEPLSNQLQMLTLLDYFGRHHEAASRAAGVPLQFFLTSFTPVEPYLDAMESLRVQRFGLQGPVFAHTVRDNLIPPPPAREDFLGILARTRLFITFHNNISDMLLCEALGNDIPTLILGCSPYEPVCRMLDMWGMEHVEGCARWSASVVESQPDLGDTDFSWLNTDTWPRGGHDVLSRIFLDSWDRLWSWATRR